VQTAYHNRSFSLYASLGFQVREPLVCLHGKTRTRSIPGCTVRPAQAGDAAACNRLALRLHGFDRGRDLSQAIQQGSALVVERGGALTGYTTELGYVGHAIAETNTDLQALIASVGSFDGPGILLPARNSLLLEWCLANGLSVVQLQTLMSIGLYSEPAGAWLPSVLY